MLSLHAEPNESGGFLRITVMPKLERLTIYNKWSRLAVNSFIAQHTIPLTHLSLVRIRTLSDEKLFELLQNVPSLVHLHVSSAVGTQSLTALTPSSSGNDAVACLCPSLQFIELKCFRPYNLIVEMVERRWHSCPSVDIVTQLTRARLHLHSWPDTTPGAALEDAGLVERLQECKDEGMDIKWQL